MCPKRPVAPAASRLAAITTATTGDSDVYGSILLYTYSAAAAITAALRPPRQHFFFSSLLCTFSTLPIPWHPRQPRPSCAHTHTYKHARRWPGQNPRERHGRRHRRACLLAPQTAIKTTGVPVCVSVYECGVYVYCSVESSSLTSPNKTDPGRSVGARTKSTVANR